jgi:pantothenate kinase
MTIEIKNISEAVARIRYLFQANNKRIIIGIVGKPGAGKSTFAAELIKNLTDLNPTLVPMDGYHLSNKQLKKLNLEDKKGAPNTFDVLGFTNLLQRINTEISTDVYFPVFHREIEESYSADAVVTKDTKIVITEGNYLLVNEGGWERVAGELVETWYLKVDEDLRLERLIKRHKEFGKDQKSAESWAKGSDEINAKIVESTASRANVIVQI